MKKTIIAGLVLFACTVQAQKSHVAYINATLHQGNGSLIRHGLFVTRDNKIETVTDLSRIRLDYKSFDTVIDLAGQHIYPALINMNNVLGLHDAEAVRATADYAEVGALNSHVRALIAYNTDNAIVPTVRCNGVLYTQVTPRANLISGSSSIMALDGWNWEDAVLKADDGIHLNFPRFPLRHSDDEKIYRNQVKKYNDDLTRLEEFFTGCAAYLKEKEHPEKNIRYEAMRPCMQGNARLYIHCDRARDILSAIDFSNRHRVSHMVIVGGKDAWKVTADLRRFHIPVVLNRVNDLPDRIDENVDQVYSLPAKLWSDSVFFCLQMEGDMEAMHSRNLSYNAGSAVAYGLDPEIALQAITLNAAKILGVDQYIGSLEEGKLASFVVCEGDLLDMRTSRVTAAFIAGKALNLENRQTDLYRKYKSKYTIK